MLAIKRFFRWEDKTNISDNWLVRRKYIHSSPENFYLSTKPELPFLFFTYTALIQVLTDSRNEYTFHDSIQT